MRSTIRAAEAGRTGPGAADGRHGSGHQPRGPPRIAGPGTEPRRPAGGRARTRSISSTRTAPMTRLLAGALLGIVSCAALAADKSEDAVRTAIQSLVPGASIDSISESVLPGFYEVVIGGQIAYVSGDGKYLVQGSIYDIQGKTDLTAASRAVLRREALSAVPDAKRIVFSPATPKHTLSVFTDIDCGYCRRKHQQIAEYNQLGIAVEYLFFPRAGIGSESYDKAVNVWCAADRKDALTAAKAG